MERHFIPLFSFASLPDPGLVYGAALGDIVGLMTRWMTPDQCMFHYGSGVLEITDIVQDQHRVPWRVGDWTSNFDIFVSFRE